MERLYISYTYKASEFLEQIKSSLPRSELPSTYVVDSAQPLWAAGMQLKEYLSYF
jgi:hypothetical protein